MFLDERDEPFKQNLAVYERFTRRYNLPLFRPLSDDRGKRYQLTTLPALVLARGRPISERGRIPNRHCVAASTRKPLLVVDFSTVTSLVHDGAPDARVPEGKAAVAAGAARDAAKGYFSAPLENGPAYSTFLRKFSLTKNERNSTMNAGHFEQLSGC